MSVILLVEDNPHIIEINTQALAIHNFCTLQAESVTKCREILEHNEVDLIVLDIMLPDGNGIELCKEIKSKYNIPILFLSALGKNDDMIDGLRAGGDDYLAKPYDIELLIARIEARIRESNAVKRFVRYGNIKLDTVSLCGYLSNEDMLLTQKEFSLLLFFIKNAERTIDICDLYFEIWGSEVGKDKRVLYTTISRVRKKLDSDKSDVMISMKRNEGYILEKK